MSAKEISAKRLENMKNFISICSLFSLLTFSLHAESIMPDKAIENPSPVVIVPTAADAKLKPLSATPRIFLIKNFLSSSECDHLIKNARPALARSMVINSSSAQDLEILHDARTSQGMFFPQNHTDTVLSAIEKRIASLTNIPQENGEGLQVLFYGIGGEYQPHYDYFDTSTPGEKQSYDRGGQRIATLIMYLHTTKEGGETIFPKAGVHVTPIKGDAVLFYNCDPYGKEDPMSLHGGAPVIKGEKWIATKWMRMGAFR